MKNSNLSIKLSCIIPVILISCTVNLNAQNELNGYTYLGYRGSYDGSTHYYYLSNCETTWDEANAAAVEMGGYLAILTEESNYGENSYVGEWAAYYVWNDDELKGAWIGLRGENGIYEWINGETIGYENWAGSPIQEPFYADGASLIGGHHWGPSYWTTFPITGEAEFIVEFPFQPNCNNNPNKAFVCHNGNTICVNVSALQGHLDHGDLEGPCGPCNIPALQALPDETLETEGDSLQSAHVVLSELDDEVDVAQKIFPSNQINVFPNPASEEIHVVLPEAYQECTLRILSLTGQEIHVFQLSGQQSINVDLSNHAAGIYLIDVRSDKGHYQKKIVKI